MNDYKIIGLDLAKKKLHIAALDQDNSIVLKKAFLRDDFFAFLHKNFTLPQTFAFEACGGCHAMGQKLVALGHRVILLKPLDVKAYAKSRQKNDINDAIAIAKAALDPDLRHVHLKTEAEQEIAYFHKTRQNVIIRRIQLSNALLSALYEHDFLVKCGKAVFASKAAEYVEDAFKTGKISAAIYDDMLADCAEIESLLSREKALLENLERRNKACPKAQMLLKIPGIGPINASLLSIKPMASYENPRDFAASLGLVPSQNTTGGHIRLSGISKKGDRYARTMLIQGARCLVMRALRPGAPQTALYTFIQRLKEKGKKFNVIAVAVANKLARIAHACLTKQLSYRA